MAGKLRRALEQWASDKFSPAGGPGWWERVKARWTEFSSLYNEFEQKQGNLPWNLDFTWNWNGLYYALTGGHSPIQSLRDRISGKAGGDISQWVGDGLENLFQTPAIREAVETLGTIITEPVLTLFENYAAQENPDPKEFARAFHGFMIGLNLTGGIASTVIEASTAGAVKGAGKLLDQMYWSLGLGFLGWQTLAPLLENGLQPGLRRHYQKLYRPERFQAADLRDLYAIGKITLNDFKAALTDGGWRDQDLDTWIQLAYRNLNEGDIWAAYHAHDLDQAEATRRLRILGYNPDDIPLLFKLNPQKDVTEVREFSAATARRAFRESLMNEAELLATLENLGYSEKEAGVIVQIENLARSQDVKSLSQSQIKSAWSENVITDPEADHWLETSGFGSEERKIILDTWKAEAVPLFRKLNVGTITGAYIEGIINRSQAEEKLAGVGLQPDDAKLELDLVEKRNPEAFGGASSAARRHLSASQLAELVVVGLLTPEAMKKALTDQGFTETDAKLLTDAAIKELQPAPRPLPQFSIERAYLARVTDRTLTTSLLRDLGLTAENAEIVIDTLEAENPDILSGPADQAARLLSPTILEDLLIAGLISPDEMNERLLLLNFSAIDAETLTIRAIQLAAPFVRPLTAIQIERAYLAAVIDRTTALEKLASVGYTQEDADQLIRTAEAENPAVFDPSLGGSNRSPSIGTLAAAVQNEIISVDQYFSRAAELGYTPNDAALYLSLANRQERKSVQTLSLAQISGAYDAGLLSWERSLSRITRLGYSNEDATLILRTRKDLIRNTEVYYSLAAGDLDAISAISQLSSAGYSDEDILAAFQTLDPAILGASNLTLNDLAAILTEIPGGA